MNYVLAFTSAFLTSAVLTPVVKIVANRLGVLDTPTIDRKIHAKAMPLLGGLAIFLSFALVVLYFMNHTDQLVKGYLDQKHLIGIILAGMVLMIGGYLDDRYNLKPKYQILFPILATLITICAGIGITSISNPIEGGFFRLDLWKFEIIRLNGVPYFFTPLTDIFTFVWLMGMMYTTKYLNGLDGLTEGVSLIAVYIMFFVALNVTLQQDYIALLAAIIAGALSGFLLYNFHPASIFLGEGGSLFCGYLVGALAILSGSKIATALLVFGVPIFDLIWVIVRRIFTGQNITIGDKKHLHHRLLSVGLSHRNAVLLIYFLTFIFGITASFLQTRYKLIVLGCLVAFMIIFATSLVWLYNKKYAQQKN
jgi:UDP-GlcNAc:undecaprenyl-phosphate GlcNAc-1-phosphate transferase